MSTLVVDDDFLAARLVEARLLQRFPDLVVEATTRTDELGSHEIYLIDNDFEGELLGPALARTLRRDNPDSLILAFSGTLDEDVLKELLNAGCNGACDKTSASDFETLLEIVGAFIERRQEEASRSPGTGLKGIITSMTQLLREWNQRLNKLDVR